MCLWKRQIFHGHKVFQHSYYVTSFKSINIVFETGRYHSWPNTLPFLVGYRGPNTHIHVLYPRTRSIPNLYNTACSTVQDGRFELFEKDALEIKCPTNQGRFAQSMQTSQLPSRGTESCNISNDGGPRALTTNLKTVKCGCKTGCEAWWCGCRKKDQQCTALRSYQGGKKCSEDYNPELQNAEYARRGPILIKDLLHKTRNFICENTPVITAGLLHVWCAVTARNYEYPFIQYCEQRKFCIFQPCKYTDISVFRKNDQYCKANKTKAMN